MSFSDYLATRIDIKKKKLVKHNSKDRRIGDQDNLGEEREGEDYIVFSWQVLEIRYKDKFT